MQGSVIPYLIDRLARLAATEAWADALTPAQLATIDYLARANRFSRAPSAVAEFLGTTRGTTSQTLKALARKALVSEARSDRDRRSIRYDLTDTGRAAANRPHPLEPVFQTLDHGQRASLASHLSQALHAALELNGKRSFGLCRTCKFHRSSADGTMCTLLDVRLEQTEAEQICHEHALP